MMDLWHSSNVQSLVFIIPELILVGMALVYLGLSLTKLNSRPFVLLLSLVVLLTVFVSSLLTFDALGPARINLFSELIVMDPFSMFARIFFVLCAVMVGFFFYQSSTFFNVKKYLEAMAFLFVLTTGLSFMAMSIDFLMTFLSLEMVSILSYLLVASKPRDAFSSEAGLKYILFGAVASGIMLFGISFLFGMVGSSDYATVGLFLRGPIDTYELVVLFFVMICLLVGFGFKMTIFPTQMWAPDVYQGAPTPVTAFLSVASKAGGFFIFMRFLFEVMLQLPYQAADVLNSLKLHEILVFFGVLSMFIGNVSALRQKNIKRMMAYSSIAHAGFILLGVSTFSKEGFVSVLLYLLIYMLMNFGAFYIIHLRVLDKGSDHIDSFRGFGNQNTWMSVAMTLFLLSLIGLPPFSGFIAKFYVFRSLIAQEYYVAALMGAINTAIAVYYYMKIIKWMFLKDGNDPEIPAYSHLSRVFVASLLIPVVLFGVYWQPILNWAKWSIDFLFA